MYKPYIKPVITAFPDCKLSEPRRSKFVLFTARLVGRIYLFGFIGTARTIVRNGRPFYEAYQRALAGKSRCIIAFRHPYGIEAQILMWFLLFGLRNKARKEKIKFCKKPHVSFVYGYEVARWGGAAARWVMPGLGALPIHHSKLDTAGLTKIIQTVSDGPYPLAIAPEGQVSYTSEAVPRLEAGAVRIGFQAAERLEKSGKNCTVEILPLSIHMRYGKSSAQSLDKLMLKIEKYTGFEQDDADFTERARRARDFILEQNEKRYNIIPEKNQSFAERVDVIMDAALYRAEKILEIKNKNNGLVERMYNIRQICWDRIVVPGSTRLDHLTLLERALLDLGAGEAWHARCHMELVDFIWYFRIPIPAEDAPLYQKIEYVQNLWDFANRTMGGAFSNRAWNIHPKQVLIQAGLPINLNKYMDDYKNSKKEAVANVMKDLETAYIDCINRAAEYQI